MMYRVGGVKSVCISVQSRRSIAERFRFYSMYSDYYSPTDKSLELIINHSFQQSTVAFTKQLTNFSLTNYKTLTWSLSILLIKVFTKIMNSICASDLSKVDILTELNKIE
jgi:hypothetical protein